MLVGNKESVRFELALLFFALGRPINVCMTTALYHFKTNRTKPMVAEDQISIDIFIPYLHRIFRATIYGICLHGRIC